MIVPLSNGVLYPKQQLSVVARAACPVFCSHLNYSKQVRFLISGKYSPDGFANGRSRRMVCFAANYKGSWEEADDGSDDNDYEDEDEDDNEEKEEIDVDYGSDLEANGNVKHVFRNGDELSVKNHEEDLVQEVERMLRPEERAILEQNEVPNLEKLSTAKWKPVHTFALAGQIKFMDGLLEKGYNIELLDKDGLTALHLAVIGKREAVISHLLRKGANPEARDHDGATPLHYAVQVGAKQTVRLLMKYKVDVNATDNEGWTPLHIAMQTRNRDIAKILLVNGADKTRINMDGNTPVDLSLCYGKDFNSYVLTKLVKQVSATTIF